MTLTNQPKMVEQQALFLSNSYVVVVDLVMKTGQWGRACKEMPLRTGLHAASSRVNPGDGRWTGAWLQSRICCKKTLQSDRRRCSSSLRLTEKCELSNYPFQVLLSNSAASGNAKKMQRWWRSFVVVTRSSGFVWQATFPYLCDRCASSSVETDSQRVLQVDVRCSTACLAIHSAVFLWYCR